MKKEKKYNDTRFKPEVISEAFNLLNKIISKPIKGERTYLTTEIGNVSWHYDNDEEFFSDYRNPNMDFANYIKEINDYELRVFVLDRNTTVAVKGKERSEIESIFEIFEKSLSTSGLPLIEEEKTSPVIFIGHGGSQQWKDLKDHLQDKHNYIINAYEVGARAGHVIRDIIESMLDRSSFAILVMTGEDLGEDGKLYPRDNVVHELGLFQGRLGSNRAIILLEDGTEEFSNIYGIQQVRYSKGNIKETFGEILATLRREFGPN